MIKRPDSDPTSWLSQANISGLLKSKGMWKPDQLAVTMVAYIGSHKAVAANETAIILGKPSFAQIIISGR
jgi:hypothetical protein